MVLLNTGWCRQRWVPRLWRVCCHFYSSEKDRPWWTHSQSLPIFW